MNTIPLRTLDGATGRVRTARFNVGLATVLLTVVGPAGAAIKIVQVFPGTPASPQAHYVMLQMTAPAQSLVAGRAITIHNAAGTEIARYIFPRDVRNGASQAFILIATPQAEQFFGVQADLEMTPTLPAAGGKVCFTDNIDCVAWGAYTGSPVGVGTPFNQNIRWHGGRTAVRRLDIAGLPDTLDDGDDTDNSANDFLFRGSAPVNNANATGRWPGYNCGNGRLDGMEQCDDGNTVNGDACNSTCTDAISTGAIARAFADFNAEGRSDVPWRNAQTGANAIWHSAISTTQQPVTGVTNQAWRVVAVGDFDNSGTADLVWRNFASGANVIWRGGNAASTQAMPTVPLAWNIVGVGDVNGDRRDDLAWRNSLTGQNSIWRSGSASTTYAITPVPNQQWQVVGFADFDGDWTADLLWRNVVTGANTIWRTSSSMDIIPVATLASAWSVAGIGDFDGDGQDDILWRNTNTGANMIWRSAVQSAPIAVANAGLAWRVVAVGDYDGDRRDDILWRNATTGANAIWRSGNISTPQAMTGVTNQAWRVVP